MGAELKMCGVFCIRTLYVLCGLIVVSHCLYEDQIGKFDWLQSYVGKLKFAVSDGTGKRVILGTEQNVVATLNLKSGQILWRQILEKEKHGQIHFLTTTNSGDAVVITGDVRGLVRAFDANTGSLVWEWLLPVKIPLDRALWAAVSDKLQVIIPVAGRYFDVLSFNMRSGGQIGAWEIVAPWAGTDRCTVSNAFIVCVTEKRLHSVSIAQPGGIVHTLELPMPAVAVSPRKSGDTGAVVIDLSSDGGKAQHVVLLKEDGEAAITCKPDMPGAAVQLISPEGGRGKLFMLQIIAQPQSVVLLTTDCTSGQAVDELSGTVPWPESLGAPKVALDMCGMRKDDSLLCRLLLHTDDHAIALLQYPGKVMWVREEALASISVVEMLDLPVSDTDAAIEKEFDSKEAGLLGMVGRRLVSQTMQLQHLFQTVLGLREPSPAVGRRADLVRDEFGLHKMIVVATGANKIFGIDNLSGEIVWQQTLSGVDSTAMQLFVQRTTRHGPPQCTLLLKDRVTKEGVFFTFNPITGLGETRRLGYRVQQAMLLPVMDSEALRGLLLMDTNEQVHVEPASAYSIALAIASTTYMYVANPSTGLITGYSITPANNELVATRVWEVVLKPGVQTLMTVVGKSPSERVHSQGRVLADRSVLYKYVNPNLVCVVTQGNDPVHKYVLNLFLLDAVSGAVVFSVSHKRAREPVHLVHTENWLVYSYFSEKWRRTEIAAIELYEGKTQSSTVFSSLASPIQPLVERQSYILPNMVQAMRPTITEKGITSRHVLVGLTNGMVLEVPWMFVDPRRPIAATPEMREEGVIPYMPELPIPAESVINYNRSLPRITGIHTSPSGLESTSLVLIYGLDLFYTRVAPSKTFDLLKEDFDPFLISMVLVGLCLASYTTRRLASRKTLKAAWK